LDNSFLGRRKEAFGDVCLVAGTEMVSREPSLIGNGGFGGEVAYPVFSDGVEVAIFNSEKMRK
jgi:hypothetical protein